MKNKTIKILSNRLDEGKRIDIFLSEKLEELSRSNIKTHKFKKSYSK